MEQSLTLKQAIILHFIKCFINKNGYAPTIREICDGVGLKSSATVFIHLKHLKEKGCITFEEKKPRTIKIL